MAHVGPGHPNVQNLRASRNGVDTTRFCTWHIHDIPPEMLRKGASDKLLELEKIWLVVAADTSEKSWSESRLG